VRRFLRHRWVDLIVALALFAGSLTVYNATLTPSLSYKSPDGNELATVPYLLGLVHSTGYPLYTWLGKLFTFLPVGDVAHRMNLMSATLGAAGVGMLYLLLMLGTGAVSQAGAGPWQSVAGVNARRLAALFATLLFAFSLTFWSQTGIAEVYAPNVLMVTLTLLTLLAWAWVEEGDQAHGPVRTGWRAFVPSGRSLGLLFLFGLVFGLSLGTHMSNLGFAPGFALFILLVNWRTALSPAAVGVAGMGFLLGILQFLWLPYKAASLNDPLMLRHAPSTLQGIYNYTLGAFPQFKFAFEWWQLPERIVLYEDMLRQQYGLWGIALGLYGMAEMVWRRPKRFFLFIGMYLVHIWFFIQYRAFDLDVFFIPAHLIYAVFIGFGVSCLLGYLEAVWRRAAQRGERSRWAQWAVNGCLALLMALLVTGQVQANWEVNDYSNDTAINDFYANVWDMLPPDSVLLGRGGVFGYDMFYWRLVYDVRPDVLIPMLTGTRPAPSSLAGRPVYTTMPAPSSGRSPAQGRTPWSPPASLTPPDAWYVPVLLGGGGHATGRPAGAGRGLTLYRVQSEPPRLTTSHATPQFVVEERLGSLTLLGFDLLTDTVQPGGRLSLTLYWQGNAPFGERIATALGDTQLEAHPLGLGNLQRYRQEIQPAPDEVIVETYSVVVPSTLSPGGYPLTVGLQSSFAPSFGGQSQPPSETLTLTQVKVTLE